MDRYLTDVYVQKSYNFLYPLLGFRKNETFVPYNTYLWWSGKESIDSWQLIVRYDKKETPLFDKFEQERILKHDCLERCYQTEKGRIYIFDMTMFSHSVEHFLKGKYSKYTENVKKQIMNFWGADYNNKDPRPGRVVHCALYPELYFEEVAREIKVPVEDLRKLGQLCSTFNKSKETLKVQDLNLCNLEEQKSQLSL